MTGESRIGISSSSLGPGNASEVVEALLSQDRATNRFVQKYSEFERLMQSEGVTTELTLAPGIWMNPAIAYQKLRDKVDMVDLPYMINKGYFENNVFSQGKKLFNPPLNLLKEVAFLLYCEVNKDRWDNNLQISSLDFIRQQKPIIYTCSSDFFLGNKTTLGDALIKHIKSLGNTQEVLLCVESNFPDHESIAQFLAFTTKLNQEIKGITHPNVNIGATIDGAHLAEIYAKQHGLTQIEGYEVLAEIMDATQAGFDPNHIHRVDINTINNRLEVHNGIVDSDGMPVSAVDYEVLISALNMVRLKSGSKNKLSLNLETSPASFDVLVSPNGIAYVSRLAKL